MADIKNSRILIIATNGFEQKELEVPRDKLREAGAKVDVASPDGKAIMGWDEKDWGSEAEVDLKIADARAGDYHVLVIPGVVLTSSRKNLPAWSRIRSARPHPAQPAASNARRASVRISASAASSNPGQIYFVSSATYLAL